MKKNAEAKVGTGELREAYGSDFGWHGFETGEEGDKDMGSVFKKAYRHTYNLK